MSEELKTEVKIEVIEELKLALIPISINPDSIAIEKVTAFCEDIKTLQKIAEGVVLTPDKHAGNGIGSEELRLCTRYLIVTSSGIHGSIKFRLLWNLN